MSNEPLPPLNSLQAFEAAGRHESFLYAAAELQVSPGAISRHVRQLERFLGTELFVRQSNAVTLTPAGNPLRPEGEPHRQGPEKSDGRSAHTGSGRRTSIRTPVTFAIAERRVFPFDRAELRIEVHNTSRATFVVSRCARECADSPRARMPAQTNCGHRLSRARDSLYDEPQDCFDDSAAGRCARLMHHLLPSRFRRLPVERRKRVARVRLKELSPVSTNGSECASGVYHHGPVQAAHGECMRGAP